MKTKLLIVLFFFLSLMGFAQSPEAFNFQTVIRDGAGLPLVNQNVSIRTSIRESTPTGTILFQDLHLEQTNQFGLVSMAIGEGIVTSGSFSGISWGSANMYLEIEVDPTGGSSFVSMGTQQLLSVPYALYAETSGNQSTGQHYIGEFYGGGIVVAVWNGGQNGLIMSTEELNNGLTTSVGDSAAVLSLAQNQSLISTYDGSGNSQLIVSAVGTNGGIPYGAKLCSDYSSGGYSDWFLRAWHQWQSVVNNSYMLNQGLLADGNPNTVLLNGCYQSSTFDFGPWAVIHAACFYDSGTYIDILQYFPAALLSNAGFKVRAFREF